MVSPATAGKATQRCRVDCGLDSLDQQFLKDLEGVSIWFLKNSRLYLDIKYDTGTMEFSRLLK